MSDPQQQLHAIVSGQVQGVSFRYYTQQCAEKLGLTGWVKNLPSGQVEVLAEGPRAALESLLAFLHHGPRLARVTGVQAEWATASREFGRFAVRA